MTTFIIRRVVWTIPVILLVILMTFLMMRQIGGNPFRHTERNVPPAIQANLERKFHLDKPWYTQYAYYVKGVFTFDLGPSMSQRTRTVNDVVKDGFPRSLKLGILAYLWAILFGVPAGILAALKPNSIFDYGAMLFSSVGFALPSFFVATLLIYYVGLKAGLVPTNGWPAGFWQFDDRIILPSFALGLFPMAYFARLVRGAMLETMQQDYVRTAKAKGLRYRRVIGLHVLRNSLIPAVTATAPLLGLIITGTFVIEFIFSIPGIGRYFINSVSNRDYSVVMGITVLTSIIIVIANLFVDIMYGVLDPRTREAR
ncbi:MAG TPA: ABC transporter permease [Gaiellaceae bacterium]|jgi:ABC-type dipeptide/oligopeptide/nickel transport system permease component|nr:ABC transporter permease [Gaiellaceae bacterium]